MISNNSLFLLIKKAPIIIDLYDKEMDNLALQNKGKYYLDEETQRKLANKAFNSVLKDSKVNVSYEECVAIFDIIGRNRY